MSHQSDMRVTGMPGHCAAKPGSGRGGVVSRGKAASRCNEGRLAPKTTAKAPRIQPAQSRHSPGAAPLPRSAPHAVSRTAVKKPTEQAEERRRGRAERLVEKQEPESWE